MDFTKITDENYWCFGCFLKKGNVDVKALKDDADQIEYFIAAMSFKAGDKEISARLVQQMNYTWIVDGGMSSEDFKEMMNSEAVKKFTTAVSEKVNAAVEYLNTNFSKMKKDWKAAGVDVSKIDSFMRMSSSVLERLDKALANPTINKKSTPEYLNNM